MTKLTTGMLVGFGAVLAGWWVYNKRKADEMAHADRGEVIFSNRPVAY